MPSGVYQHKTGYKHTVETKRKIGKSNSVALKGYKQSEERKKRQKEIVRKIWESGKRSRVNLGVTGSKNVNWKGGVTPINEKIRKSSEYKLWREAVFARDGYTCIWCGKKGGELNADHIKPFAYYPELRFAIDNGRTLCVPCHKTTDTYSGKGLKRIKKIIK
jgi:5-methylcytosine-specific restriction endonuclease McrA